jgi:hypothetical protein
MSDDPIASPVQSRITEEEGSNRCGRTGLIGELMTDAICDWFPHSSICSRHVETWPLRRPLDEERIHAAIPMIALESCWATHPSVNRSERIASR